MSGYRAALESDSSDRVDIVEGLLDSTAGTIGPKSWTPTESVRALLEEIAVVCQGNDEHVSDGHGSNDPDAREWRKAAKLVEAAAARLSK